MADQTDLLTTFLAGWNHYQALLVEALTPLTEEQLGQRIAPHLRSVGEIATHIVDTRAGWTANVLHEGDDALAAISLWGQPDQPAHSAAELVSAMQQTGDLLRSCLARWTPADLATPVAAERGGKSYSFMRSWVVWHLIEHDLHHGGELIFTLGALGIAHPNL